MQQIGTRVSVDKKREETRLDDLGVPRHTSRLDATTEAHGLLPRLSGSSADLLSGSGSWTSSTPLRLSPAGITLNGSPITTGIKGTLNVLASSTITGWQMTADQSGSIVIDVKRATYSGYPTTASLVGGGTKPTLSAAQKNQDSTLTGWTTSLAAGDVLEFVVDSVSTVESVTLTLTLQRS